MEQPTTPAEMAEIVRDARNALHDALQEEDAAKREELLDTAHQYLHGDMVTIFIEQHAAAEETEG